MVWFLMISLLVALDQILKAIVVAYIHPTESISVIQGFFYLVHRTNAGGAWSLFSNRSWGLTLLIVISALASIFMLLLLVRWRATPLRLAMTFTLAGSIGNLIDRIAFRGVTDFLSFHFWSYEFPTFNLADILIVCGTITMILILLIHPDWMSTGEGDNRRIVPK